MNDNYDTYGVSPDQGGPNYAGGTFGGNDMPYGTGWNNYGQDVGGYYAPGFQTYGRGAWAPPQYGAYRNAGGGFGGGGSNFGYYGHGGYGTPGPYGNPPGGFGNGLPSGAHGSQPYVGNAAGSYGTGGSTGYWPGWGYGQPNYQQPQTPLSDEQIEEHVSDALDRNPVTSNADINVEVHDHVVTLTGQVKSRHTKMLADDIAWNSPGVNDVHNQIQVTGRKATVAAGAGV